jgi:hypothetical protein
VPRGPGPVPGPPGVPADLLADPLVAAVALVEVRLHLVDGLGYALSRVEPRAPSRIHSASRPSCAAFSPTLPPTRSPPSRSIRPPNPVAECWNEDAAGTAPPGGGRRRSPPGRCGRTCRPRRARTRPAAAAGTRRRGPPRRACAGRSGAGRPRCPGPRPGSRPQRWARPTGRCRRPGRGTAGRGRCPEPPAGRPVLRRADGRTRNTCHTTRNARRSGRPRRPCPYANRRARPVTGTADQTS